MGRAGRHKQAKGQSAAARPKRWLPRHRRAALDSLIVAILVGGLGLVGYLTNAGRRSNAPSSSARKVQSLEDLLASKPEDLAGIDIAEMNLLCATGLPGAEDLDIDKCLAKLDRWADRVKHETERHLYRLTDPKFHDHAEHYRHSEARFRAEWLVSVLQQDIGLHYHAGFVAPDQPIPPFKTSKQSFIHGLMDHEDGRRAFGGNCVSLPVAYAAVGRRLGYPVKLVCANEHVFCRWEGLDHSNPAWRDRFNFDGAGDGFSIDPDEFYLTWPRKTTPDQVELCGWLKTLTAAEELSVFLAGRGAVLMDVSRDFGGALVAFAHAARLRPTSSQSIDRVHIAYEKMFHRIAVAHPAAYRKFVARVDGKAGTTTRPDGRVANGPPRSRLGRDPLDEMVDQIDRRNAARMQQLYPSPGVPQEGWPFNPQAPPPGTASPYGPHQPPLPPQPPR